jgi:hypothetical protein
VVGIVAMGTTENVTAPARAERTVFARKTQTMVGSSVGVEEYWENERV